MRDELGPKDLGPIAWVRDEPGPALKVALIWPKGV
jgi:hypothetical protein